MTRTESSKVENRNTSFFEELDSTSELLQLFEYLPDTHVFVKDSESTIVAANRHFAHRMGFEDPAELIGKSTWDICPKELAEKYVQDDQRIMQSDKKLVDINELNQAADGTVNWFITSKIPLHRKDGSVAGIAGIARDVKKAKVIFEPYDRFVAVFDHIVEHYGERITIAELAKKATMSTSQFNRHFKHLFGLSPTQHIIQYRIQKACRELTYTAKTIAEIATATGFYDQSAMTRFFARHLKTTPKAYRIQSRKH
ncbi:MAG: AraC family transcriptional regulator [Kiritimatiellales bacterium]|nr:AraC family transcriptional regulator [Kiritimatiellales bacterium]MCF7863890.1 AraC family transcriptional regulator [Kiritimatiellales bacterium]